MVASVVCTAVTDSFPSHDWLSQFTVIESGNSTIQKVNENLSTIYFNISRVSDEIDNVNACVTC